MNTTMNTKVVTLFNALSPEAKLYILAKLVELVDFLPVESHFHNSDDMSNINKLN